MIRSTETQKVKAVNPPAAIGKMRSTASPMAAGCSESMQQQDRLSIRWPAHPPVTTPSLPLPELMVSPLGSLDCSGSHCSGDNRFPLSRRSCVASSGSGFFQAGVAAGKRSLCAAGPRTTAQKRGITAMARSDGWLRNPWAALGLGGSRGAPRIHAASCQ